MGIASKLPGAAGAARGQPDVPLRALGGSHVPAQKRDDPARRPGQEEREREAASASGGDAGADQGQRPAPHLRGEKKGEMLFEFVGGAYSLEMCKLALEETKGNLDQAAGWLFDTCEGYLTQFPSALNKFMETRPRRSCAEKESGFFNERKMTAMATPMATPEFRKLQQTAKEQGTALVKSRASRGKGGALGKRNQLKLITIEEPIKGNRANQELFPITRDVPEIQRVEGRRWEPMLHALLKLRSGEEGENSMHSDGDTTDMCLEPIEVYDKEGAAPIPADIQSITRRNYTQHSLVDPTSRIGKAVQKACDQNEGKNKIILSRRSIEDHPGILKRTESDLKVFGQEILAALRGECNPNVEVKKIVDPKDPVYAYQHPTGGGVYGIFAKMPIKAGTVLGQYVGEVRQEEDSKENEKGEYSIGLPDWLPGWTERHGVGTLFIDSEYFANEMSYINDARGSGKPVNCLYVGGYCNDWPFVVIITTLDLEPGDQVYVDYGYRKYWRIVDGVDERKKEEMAQSYKEYGEECIKIKKEKQDGRQDQDDGTLWTPEDSVVGITEDDSLSDDDEDDDATTVSSGGQQEGSNSVGSHHHRAKPIKVITANSLLDLCDVLLASVSACISAGQEYSQEAENITKALEDEVAALDSDAEMTPDVLLRLGKAAHLQRLVLKKRMDQACSTVLKIELARKQVADAIEVFDQPYATRTPDQAKSAKHNLVRTINRSKDLCQDELQRLDNTMQAEMLEGKDPLVETDAKSIRDVAQRHGEMLEEEEPKWLAHQTSYNNLLGLLEDVLVAAPYPPLEQPAARAVGKRKKTNWAPRKSGNKSRKVSRP